MLRLVRVIKSTKICFGLMVITCLGLFLILSFNNVEAYYGLSGLGLYGSGIYGGSYGLYGLGGLYSMGCLYGLGGTYGLSGLYGLGGLYGMGSLYGLSGLSGLGGLYGLGSLYGLGGSYGLSGLYGLGSLYGTGGLYGMSSLYGLGGITAPNGIGGLLGLSSLFGRGGIYGIGGLGGLLGSSSPLSSLGLLSPGVQSTTPAAPVVTAEQAGTWTGTWISFIKLNAGFMNLTLVEDTLSGLLSGETNLILNKITKSIPAQVSGVFSGGTTFTLTGRNNPIIPITLLLTTTALLTSYTIQLNCTLTSPTTMTGTYTIQDLVKLDIDYGSFNLTLSTPVI
jgi:hypothetical protein